MRYCSLPVENLQAWAHFNNIELHGVAVKSNVVDRDGMTKGGGLVATRDHAPGDALIKVPNDLILSRALVEDAARVDKNLRQILDAVGLEFAKKPRTTIMIFLLIQLTYASLDINQKNVGIKTPLTDYVQFLPKSIPLPTFFDEQERSLLQGTSLAATLEQKLQRLEEEFMHLQASTQASEWCQETWWNENRGALSLKDWNLVDALYRSRAVEVPGSSGDCMLPVIDMANHASEEKYNARFDLDEQQTSMLLLCKDRPIRKGEEITLHYGSGGACEMIFSYGFLEELSQSAGEMYLPFNIPHDDPLKRAKTEFAKEAPAIRIFRDSRGHIQWKSALVWWACVNEEDGLRFQVLRRNDGGVELKTTWKGIDLEPGRLVEMLSTDARYNVFLLRAIVFVQDCVETQGSRLSASQDLFDPGIADGFDSPAMDMIARLRDLEMDLLTSAYEHLDTEKARLLDSETVRAYFDQLHDPDRADGAEAEDFS